MSRLPAKPMQKISVCPLKISNNVMTNINDTIARLWIQIKPRIKTILKEQDLHGLFIGGRSPIFCCTWGDKCAQRAHPTTFHDKWIHKTMTKCWVHRIIANPIKKKPKKNGCVYKEHMLHVGCFFLVRFLSERTQYYSPKKKKTQIGSLLWGTQFLVSSSYYNVNVKSLQRFATIHFWPVTKMMPSSLSVL